MNEYLKNIVGRLQKYSAMLDKMEVFIDKPWIFFDEQNNTHEYLFLRDSRLIMSLNGKVTEGRWELLPNGKLLVNRISDQIMLQNMFIDDALMILKKSGSDDDSFVLINEKVIPDLDALKYLEKQEARKEISHATENNIRLVISSGLVTGSNFLIGDKIESYDGTIVSGTFRSTRESHEEYVVVENGKVQSTFYHVQYTIENKAVILQQKYLDRPKKGDVITNLTSLEIDVSKKIRLLSKYQNEYTMKVNDLGEIIYINDEQFYNVILAIVVIVILMSIAILLGHSNISQ